MFGKRFDFNTFENFMPCRRSIEIQNILQQQIITANTKLTKFLKVELLKYKKKNENNDFSNLLTCQSHEINVGKLQPAPKPKCHLIFYFPSYLSFINIELPSFTTEHSVAVEKLLF